MNTTGFLRKEKRFLFAYTPLVMVSLLSFWSDTILVICLVGWVVYLYSWAKCMQEKKRGGGHVS